MALTGALIAFQSELTAWFENDVRVASTGVPRLSVSELIRRATSALGSDVKTNSVQFERSPTAPAVLGADVRFWLLDPYDGRVLRPSAIRGFFLVAEEVHWSIGLVLLGMRGIGTALAGLVTIGILLLSLTGPWLWCPQKPTSAELRKRLGFSGSLRSATRSFAWHHIVGIWCMPVILATSVTGILLHYQGARDGVGALLGNTPDAQVALDADSAVREAIANAPDWSALRLWWSDDGAMTLRVRFAGGGRPTQWAELESGAPEPVGLRRVTLRRYQDGRAGDKVLGWARWVHTGQAFGHLGQAIWGLAVLGILVLAWTGLAMALSRIRRWPAKTFAHVDAGRQD
jgi:uncharacterized iron-regulated membrane protein